ncbi:Nucleotide-diphospho-sugar transferase [Gracilaria domingensis]|nr:Nucleotide-diphospho-sugar transferase [Gracilaria domingensis]
MDGLRARARDRRQSGVAAAAAHAQRGAKRRATDCCARWSPQALLLLLQSALIVCLSAAWYLARSNADACSQQRRVRPDPPSASAESEYDFFITVYSYDRPRQLLRLLQDVRREAQQASLRVGVNVIDDNSLSCVFQPSHRNIFESYSSSSALSQPLHHLLPDQSAPCSARHRFRDVETFLANNSWSLFVSHYRHARRRYWHLVRMAHSLLHPIPSTFYIFLPDDDRLAHNFFQRVTEAWNSIQHARKLTLMLHVEQTRESVAVWTDFKPRNVGGSITRIGWVESGNFMCTEHFLRFLNWSFPHIGVERWVRNPPISSGVGATLSELLHSSGHRMYRTHQSYVAHIGVSLSKMNAEFREKNAQALLTKYFADGDHVYRQYLTDAATVTVSIASVWTREAALHSAVHSLAPQVDRMNVYLNGYDSVPSFLHAPYITVIRSQDKTSRGDVGDIGKFFWCNDIETDFHLTADDDIIYPPDYVEKLLQFSHSYSPPVVVGVHGIRIIQQDLIPPTGGRGKGYYGSRKVFMAVEQVRTPKNVHIIGTGTMMYRPQDIGHIDIDSTFQEPNMADVWFGLLAQKLKMPMMIIPHEEGWIKEVPGTFEDSIYKRSTRSRTSDRLQTRAAKSIEMWKLYPPLSNAT